MLNELIEALGYENISKETVSMKNSVYVRIPKDREIDIEKDVLIFDKEVEIKDLEMSEWFYKREQLSKYINSNKAIVLPSKCKHLYPKLITSVTGCAIFFKLENFLEHKNNVDDMKVSFDNLISEYLYILESEHHRSLFLNSFDLIMKVLEDKMITKTTLKLFIDSEIEEYEKDYNTHLKKSLFDKEYTLNGVKQGRVTQFINFNNKKPLLANVNSNVSNEIHLLNKTKGEEVLNLNRYIGATMASNPKTENYSIGSLTYKAIWEKKKCVINSYSNNPYKIIEDLKHPIYIRNILDNKFLKEITIYKYSELTKYIMQLMEFKIKDYYSEKDSIESKFKTFSTMYYKYIYNINNSNFETFKRIFDNMSKSMLNLYIEGEHISKINNILNFTINMKDYLYNTNIREELMNMINKIKSKILIMKTEYIIEDDMEFYVLTGQLAKYLKGKTSTDTIKNEVFYEYNIATRTKQVIDILQRDMNSFGYDENNYGRASKLLYAINNYYTINEDELLKIDKVRFNMGLYYGNCVLYVSSKENKENNKEEKGDN